ncbi:MAG: hypothetical protein K5656_01815 [Lachnospiraceae bacterium]|nr:hypothetical protein [Lachnospiraceae bacterium]
MTKQLTDNEIKELIVAQVEYKKAKDKFDEVKERLTKDLEPGRYESKYGKIIKTVFTKMKTDYKRMLWDNPDIDIKQYEEPQEVSSLVIQNYNTSNGIFG